VAVKEMDTFKHLPQQPHRHILIHAALGLNELKQLAALDTDHTVTHNHDDDDHNLTYDTVILI